MPPTGLFTPDLFKFLAELRLHNDRDWFQAQKERYARSVKDPCVAFVEAFAAPLRQISRHYRADPKPAGGSVFRIHRDVRFSPDKSPYKTTASMIFFHEAGREKTPVFYLQLTPGDSLLAVGLYHPAPAVAGKVRAAIAAKPAVWRRATDVGPAAALGGEQLKRPPKGIAADHPLVEDLKRKDFVLTAPLTEKEVVSAAFLANFAERCAALAPLNRFLCGALGLAF